MNPTLTLQDDGRLRLRYLLHELPSAQHKAGLAGLLFHSQNMQSRGLVGGIEIAVLESRAAEIVVGPDEIKTTFEDLYDAAPVTIYSRTRFTGKEPEEIVEVPVEGDTSGKTEKRYVYSSFRPLGRFFEHLLTGGPEDPWLKLWRNMLWAVLRAQPAARGDYETRANNEPLSLPANIWNALLKAAKARTKGKLIVDSVAGSLFVGAQAANAERVAFQGPVELNLLLHFWQLVTPIFAPRTIDVKNRRMTDQGYLLAIPEVTDLEEFLYKIERFWQSRTPKLSGYRPEQAVIDVPQEGGLEFIYDLAHARTDQDARLSFSISGVEWFHQEKQGNNVRMHGQGRIRADRSMLRNYESARQRRGSPLFKQLIIGNLLADRPWHQGAADLCALYPAEFFIKTDQTPRFAFFGTDARQRFKAIMHDLKAQERPAMNPMNTALVDDALIARVYQLIGAYIVHRAQERSGLKRCDFIKGEDGRVRYPKEWREAVEKVAKDAFLAMRGRNDREFRAFFTGTICSVPQFFGRQEDFIAVSQAIISDPDLIKDLSMLALSAHAWMPVGDPDAESESAAASN